MASLTTHTKPPSIQLPAFVRATTPHVPVIRTRRGPGQIRSSLIAKPFDEIAMSFDEGDTLLRLLPPLANSQITSAIYDFATYDLCPKSMGEIPELAVPSSICKKLGFADDPIADFEHYLAIKYPHLLLQNNPHRASGLSLMSKQRAACHVYLYSTPVKQSRGDYPCRLWIGSTFSGYGRSKEGVIHLLKRTQSEERIGPKGEKLGLRFGDLSDPLTGRLFNVRVSRANRNTTYESITVAEEPLPLREIEGIFRIHPKASQYLRPLEETIRCPSTDELLKMLSDAIEWKIARGELDRTARQAYADCFGSYQSSRVSLTTPASPQSSKAPVSGIPTQDAGCLVDDLGLDQAAQKVAPADAKALDSQTAATASPIHAARGPSVAVPDAVSLFDDLDVSLLPPVATTPENEVVATTAIVDVDTPSMDAPCPIAVVEVPSNPVLGVAAADTKAEPVVIVSEPITIPPPSTPIVPTPPLAPAKLPDPYTGSKAELMEVMHMAAQGIEIPSIDSYKINIAYRFGKELTQEECAMVFSIGYEM